ncbi:DUF2470 domain-containing protein [Jatrophihabitans sp. DSM 45814]
MTDCSDQFTPEVVAQIMRHMNEDHADDNVLIVQVLGELPSAERAMMSGMDADGIEFLARVTGRDVQVRLPWSERISERSQVRAEVVRLYEEAVQRSQT